MIRWLGKVAPLEYLAGCVLLGIFMFVGAPLTFILYGGMKGASFTAFPSPLKESVDMGAELLSGILWLGALGYGVYRVYAFAPVPKRPYFMALLGMPYDGRKPLLAGPLLLVPQDAVLIFAVEFVAILVCKADPGAMAVAFLLSYLVFIAGFLLTTDRFLPSYVVAVGVFLTLRFVWTPWIAVVPACLTAMVAWIFVRRLLLTFPWGVLGLEEGNEIENLKTGSAGLERKGLAVLWPGASQWGDDEREQRAGWPLGLLAPRIRGEGVGFRRAIAAGILVAFALYCVLTPFLIGSESEVRGKVKFILGFSFLGLLMAVWMRIGIFIDRYRPPISLFGRLATGRLIIPSYDVVFLTPIMALCVWGLLFIGALRTIPMNWLLPACWGMTTIILLGGPPSLGQWQCTGGHRIRISRNHHNEYIET